MDSHGEEMESSHAELNFLCDKTKDDLDIEWQDYNSLSQALRNQQKETAKCLILSGARVNRSPSILKICTPLHLAVNLGCPEIVKILLDKGALIDRKNYNNETPLIVAAKIGNGLIMDLLLSVDPQKNFSSTENLSHMHIACMRNQYKVVEKLVQQGSRINHSVKLNSLHWPGFTPLHFAVQFQCIETVKFLLNCGADITIKEAKQLTPLHIAFMLQNESMIDLILQAHKYETTNPMNLEGLSHFHIACTRNNVTVMEYFLKQGVDINMKVLDTSLNWAGCRPINFAIYFECPDVIKSLLMHNAHVNRDDIWHTPVQYAYIAANKEIISLLLNKSSLKCNSSQIKKLSHFYHACKRDDVSEIEKMILFGKAIKEPIDLNSPIWTGCTPLHLAIRHRSMKVAIFLLKNDADILIRDARGKTPLHLAFETKQMKLVDLILTNYIQFDSNALDAEGFSHFHISCIRDKLETVESFLKNGVDVNSAVDVNSKFWPGCTALHFAVQFEHKEIVDLLLKHNANVTLKNVNGLTPLDIAIKSTDSNKCWRDEVDDIFAIIDSILTASFFNGSSSFDNRGFSVLHITSINGDINAIRNFLKFHPKSINQPINWSESDWFGYTPLHFAVHFGNREAVEVLVQFGADISIKNGEGNTPLHVAFSLRNHLRAVENFEIICASDNPIGEEGFSHFHIACQIGAFRAVEYFINQGVDVNQPSKFTGIYEYTGQSPLHLAINNEVINEKVLQLLLEKGANVHARDAELDTPLHYTKNNTTTRALELLLCHGADVNAQNMFNETPLYLMCHDGEYVDRRALPEKMILLLDNGADIDIANDEGELPLAVLKYWSDDEVKYNCIVAMLKHIKKLRIIGSFVGDENKKLYNELLRQCINAGRYRETEFSHHCNDELEVLKTVNIDSYTTLHDVLFKNDNEMSVHCENQTFQKIMESTDFRERFSIYGPLIKLKFKRGLARRPLLSSSKISLNFLTGFPLPDACSEKILQFLCDKDLCNIISSREKI